MERVVLVRDRFARVGIGNDLVVPRHAAVLISNAIKNHGPVGVAALDLLADVEPSVKLIPRLAT